MRIFKKYVISMLIMFVLSLLPAYAENTASDKLQDSSSGKGISLNKFIKEGCLNNSEFKKIIMDRLYLEYKDDLNLDIGEIIADFETGYLYSPDTDKEGVTGGITVSKLFPETATDISASFDTSPGLSERSSSVSLKVSQEIAENSFGRKWHLKKESLDFEKDLVLYQVAESYEDYLYYLVTLYYDWLSIWRELETAENSYRESRKLFENILSRKENNIADQADADRSELQLLSKIEAVHSAENNYKNACVKVFDAAGLPPDSDFFPEDSENGIIAGNSEFRLDDSVKEKSRTYRILDLYEKIGEKTVDIAKNSLLPRISLFSEYSASGTGYNVSDERSSYLSFGISLTGIGEKRREQAVFETAALDLDKRKLDNSITKKDLDITLAKYINDIENRIELARIYEKKTVLAEKILLDERKKYRIGKTNLSSLIDAVNSVDLNRIKKLGYEAEINSLRAGWLNLTDSLIQEDDESLTGYDFSL